LQLVSRFASEKICRRVLMTGDIVMVSAAFLLAAILWPGSDFAVALQVDPATTLGSLAAAILSVLAVLQLGLLHSGSSWVERIQQISLSLGAVFLLEAFLSYVGFAWLLELPEAFLGSAICALLLVAWYRVFRFLFPGFPGAQRVLLLGSDVAFPEIGGALVAGAGGYTVLGPLPYPSDIRAMANEWLPDEIVVGDVASPGTFPANALLDLRFRGVTILDAATFFEAMLQRVSCRHLQPIRFLYGDITPKRQNLALQAIYSNVLGLAALAIAAPVLLVTAIALKISAPAVPLLEPYRAVGLNGVPFDRLRFQSKSPLGSWLARMRLRGLPQLFNVVRGEMSLVGPRPGRVEFHEALCRQVPYYSQRVAVRPGLTGWAQIQRGQADKRYDASAELEYDLYYVKHLSPGFDVDILLASMSGGA
jgi:lipopolysaccharide/colanic/teichoic acid biosynthesis glycosyltransferase